MLPIEQRAMKPSIIEAIDRAKVIAVLVIDDVKHAVPVAKALAAGGVNVLELTLRTPAAWEAARAIKAEVPDMCVGLGTVLTVGQVEAAAQLKVDFAVAPGLNPDVLKAAFECGLSFAPGVMTPSEIELALVHGCRVLKYFPAETSGGIKHLQNMVAPYSYLKPQFIPLGGLNLSNASSYLTSPLVTAIGGSWLAKPDMIKAEQWDLITQNAVEVQQVIASLS